MCEKKESLQQCGGEGNSKDEIAAGCENSREENCKDKMTEDRENSREEEERKKAEEEKERRKRRRRIVNTILIVIIILLILLCFRSCRARDKPLPDDWKRTYEEDCRPGRDDEVPGADEGRLNIAVAQNYRISDDKPYFYIGFPEENVYDVVFTMLGADGEELYRTDYVAPGTSVAVDGTAFLAKGERKVDCLVSIYDRDSGVLVSDCTTVVLNVSYK